MTAIATGKPVSAVEEFVTTLRRRMEVLGIKPTELAAKAHVGYPYLYRVLKGQQTPSLEWAAKVGAKVGLRIRTEVVRKSKGK